MMVLQEKKAKLDKLFGEYHKSGLGLMTTIIGLSSGAFISLFKKETTREASFLYFIPIAVALLQQLTHYLGSHMKAMASLHWLISSHTKDADKGMDAYVNAKENLEKANLLYDISYKFCLFSCISILLVSFYPIALFTSSTVINIIILIIGGCLIYWCIKWFNLKRKLDKTDWFNNKNV